MSDPVLEARLQRDARLAALAGEHLLPPNATPWEKVMSLVGAARRPLPAELIKALWSPKDCPARLLPYLAWGLSVDIWDDAWPETKQREVIAKALQLHRLKTTPAGIKAHVALTGAEVLRLIRPPARGHLKAALTEAERRAWLNSLPAIQFRPFVQPATAIRRGFHSGPAGATFHGPRTEDDADRELSRWLLPSRGPDLWGRRAFYVKDGVATPVRLEQMQDVGQAPFERVFLASSGRRRSFHGHAFAGTGHLQRSTAADNVLTVRLSEAAAAFAVEPSARRVVDVRPERMHQGRTVPAGRSFCGRRRYHGHRHLATTIAPTQIFDRIALHDPSRAPRLRRVRDYHGVGRFGIAPFTAEALIRVPMRRPPRRSGRHHGVGFRQAPDMKPLWQAVDAVRVSKAARDTVLIDTTTYRTVTLRDGLTLGSFRLGGARSVLARAV